MSDRDLSSLIGSRICHDLVNPIGAIGNGVELMLMTSEAKGPEMALIAESVGNANARIRFFRIAYGAASDFRIPRQEIESILTDLSRGGRLRMEWKSESDLPRREVRLAFLAIQCLETAMPYGGTVTVSHSEGGWRVSGSAIRFKLESRLWDSMMNPAIEVDITPALVQFALLPEGLERARRRLTLDTGPQELVLLF